ncbi:hypothetical protein [Sphingomonas melonis]|uniref:Uncharacterized protein n=1 Tax=Sphingomonas melonis TaxID=152682 RepID=A0A7Y9K0F9_9SPHN|nr:hypothetical protein [Sphingomonas melonis]NYD88881.1 hypothetical protein [Sphingomonas melonis]
MTHMHEIPTDDEVLAVLADLGAVSARDLVDALVKQQHPSRDAQRAIQRCLDRGKIELGRGMLLSVRAKQLQAA